MEHSFKHEKPQESLFVLASQKAMSLAGPGPAWPVGLAGPGWAGKGGEALGLLRSWLLSLHPAWQKCCPGTPGAALAGLTSPWHPHGLGQTQTDPSSRAGLCYPGPVPNVASNAQRQLLQPLPRQGMNSFTAQDETGRCFALAPE